MALPRRQILTAFDPETAELIAANAPEWRRDAMAAALATFNSLEEPTGAEEDWRYVEYNLPFSALTPAVAPGEPLPTGPFLKAIENRSGAVEIIDGHVTSINDGDLTVRRWADMDRPAHDRLMRSDHNKLAAAHGAFAADGLVVELAPNQVMTAPLVIDVQSTLAGSAVFPAIDVNVGENAEASVLVIYRSAPGVELLSVPEVSLRVGDGGRLRFLSLQSMDSAATIVVHQRVTLGRDATSRLGEAGLGGNLGRLDLAVDLNGDGASSEMVGLYFGEGAQTLDYRMVVNHRGRSTSSDVFLKGAVEDDAQSVFTGLLRIEKDAARTSTFETNRNLVLSENAKAHSVPNLEILCNDVVCGHASSVGPLEEENLYYMQSRGLSRQRAERLLIRGFFQEVVDRLPVPGIGKPVSDEVFRRFVTAQEEGRVG